MEILGNLTGILASFAITTWDSDHIYLGYWLIVPFCLMQNALLIKYFKHDTPTYLWLCHRRKSAISLISNLYMQPHNQEIPLEDVMSIQYYEDNTERSTRPPEDYIITYKNVIFDKIYRKSLIIACSTF
jgi:hypothetical protein